MRRVLSSLSVLLMASACVGSASGSTDTTPPSTSVNATATSIAQDVPFPATTTAPATSTTSGSTQTDTAVDHAVSEYDLQRFLAAAEFAIAGSAYEGAIYESPEIYIATAQGFCARLSQGDEIGQITQDYLAAANITKADDEDLQFVGALLGAGVQALCPEHASKL